MYRLLRLIKNFLGIVTILLASLLGANPEQTVEEFFKDFNKQDIISVDRNSDSPFIYIMGSNVVLEEKYSDAINFDGLQKEGWAYSQINKSNLLYDDNDTAMVQVNFSRFNSKDEVILTSDVTYLLVNKDGSWKLKGGFSSNLSSLGND